MQNQTTFLIFSRPIQLNSNNHPFNLNFQRFKDAKPNNFFNFLKTKSLVKKLAHLLFYLLTYYTS